MNAIEQASERLTEHVNNCAECRSRMAEPGIRSKIIGRVEITYTPDTMPELCPVAMDILREIFC